MMWERGMRQFCSAEMSNKLRLRRKSIHLCFFCLGKVKYQANTMETVIVTYAKYYQAHEEHQENLMKNPLGYNQRYRFKDWPALN